MLSISREFFEKLCSITSWPRLAALVVPEALFVRQPICWRILRDLGAIESSRDITWSDFWGMCKHQTVRKNGSKHRQKIKDGYKNIWKLGKKPRLLCSFDLYVVYWGHPNCFASHWFRAHHRMHHLPPRCNKSPPRHQAVREGRPIHDLRTTRSPKMLVYLWRFRSKMRVAKHPRVGNFTGGVSPASTTVTAQKDSHRAPASSKTSIWSSSAALASTLFRGQNSSDFMRKNSVFTWPIE